MGKTININLLKKCFAALFTVYANMLIAASLDFAQEPLLAGKQLLAEDAYYVSQTLGTSAFSPSASIPLKICYKSNSNNSGLFGKMWYAPLLESSLTRDKWITPWEEVIKLPDANKRFAKVDRMVCGINEYEGWEFLYLFGKLQKIVTPEKLSINFIYNGPDQKISALECRGVSFMTFTYNGNTISSIFNSGVIYKLDYNHGRLSKISLSNLYPTEFKYKGDKLISIIRGKIKDDIELDAAGRILSDILFKYKHQDDGIELVNPIGASTKYFYNGKQLKISQNGALQKDISIIPAFDINFMGLVTKVVTGKKVEIFKYDDKFGRLLEYTDPIQNKIINVLNRKGLITQVLLQENGSDARVLRSMEYNRLKLLETMTNYNLQGQPHSKTEYKYTQEGQAKEIITKTGSVIYTYTPFAFIETLSSAPNKNFAAYSYNDFNRLSCSISDYLYTYDYNYSGFPSEVIAVNGDDKEISRSKQYYDLYGNQALSRDINGRETKVECTYWGAPKIVTDANGGITKYEYDAARNLSNVTDPNGNSIQFIHGIWGVHQIITAENQVTEYEYDNSGRVISEKNYFKGQKGHDRIIRYFYDDYDRQIKIDYGNGYVKEFTYNAQGRVQQIKATAPTVTMISKKEYHSGLLVKEIITIEETGKKAEQIVKTQSFDNNGQRISLTVKGRDINLEYRYSYDDKGRLTEIASDEHNVRFEYTGSKISKQIIDNNIEINFTYDIYGRLLEKSAGDFKLKYFYSLDGKIIGREFCGERQNYVYDKLDQLIRVTNQNNTAIEEYVYDPAGNILQLLADGEKLIFEYDKANQIRNKKIGSKKHQYQYDAAGRLLTDEMHQYKYGWLNSVIAADDVTYSYDPNGQLAKAGNKNYIWDGLALLIAGTNKYIFEPAMTGGNPLLVNSDTMFTDILGSTLGYSAASNIQKKWRTAFGQSNLPEIYNFFTGKPSINGLGYNFFLRNYNANNGKWNGTDPLGYPDGWNNLLYASNAGTTSVDPLGGNSYNLAGNIWSTTNNLMSANTVMNTVAEGYLNLHGNVAENFNRLRKTNKVFARGAYNASNVVGKAGVIMDVVNTAMDAYSGYQRGGISGAVKDGIWSAAGNFAFAFGRFTAAHSIGYLGGEALFAGIGEVEWLYAAGSSVTDWTTSVLDNAKQGWDELWDFVFDKHDDYEKLQKIAEERKNDELNSIEIGENTKAITVDVWDYAAEDGDRVRVQHYINGKLHEQTGEITIMNTPKRVIVRGIAEGSQVRVFGTFDGGGGITYAANIGGRMLTNRTQAMAANRYKIKRRPSGRSGNNGYAQ